MRSGLVFLLFLLSRVLVSFQGDATAVETLTGGLQSRRGKEGGRKEVREKEDNPSRDKIASHSTRFERPLPGRTPVIIRLCFVVVVTLVR